MGVIYDSLAMLLIVILKNKLSGDLNSPSLLDKDRTHEREDFYRLFIDVLESGLARNYELSELKLLEATSKSRKSSCLVEHGLWISVVECVVLALLGKGPEAASNIKGLTQQIVESEIADIQLSTSVLIVFTRLAQSDKYPVLAKKALAKAYDIVPGAGDTQEVFSLNYLNQLSGIESYLNKEYDAAEKILLQTHRNVSEQFGPTYLHAVEILLDLAKLYVAQRQWESARDIIREAIKSEMQGANEKIRLAKCLLSLGFVESRRGSGTRRALPRFERALELYRKYPTYHIREHLLVLFYLGESHEALGQLLHYQVVNRQIRDLNMIADKFL